MNIFGHPKPSPEKVTSGRFEIERNGEVAYLEYSLSDKVLALIHTEVPERLRGEGMASFLIQNALRLARDHHVKVDVICPIVADYFAKHPEYSDLVLR